MSYVSLEKPQSFFGDIAISDISDLRSEEEGRGDWNHVGNLRNIYGMPMPLYSDDNGLHIALKGLFSESLEHCGIKINESSKRKFAIDVEQFFCDGYMGYSVKCKIVIKVLYEQDVVIFKKEISNQLGFAYMTNSDLYKAYDDMMDMIMKESIEIFKSKEFKSLF